MSFVISFVSVTQAFNTTTLGVVFETVVRDDLVADSLPGDLALELGEGQ
jgi:hypothetical protein